MPTFVVKEAMERGALDLVPAEWFPEPSPLHVVYPQSRRLSRRVRVFVDWPAALISEHDGIQVRSTLREVVGREGGPRPRVAIDAHHTEMAPGCLWRARGHTGQERQIRLDSRCIAIAAATDVAMPTCTGAAVGPLARGYRFLRRL
jgi:hypothetical protein